MAVGYSDIKPCNWSWIPYFELLDSTDNYAIGAPEDEGPLSTPELIRKEYGNRWQEMISADMFIFKSNTEFTNKWYSQMIKKMDMFLPSLKKYPARVSREAADTMVTNYPIRWAGILCEIFHPLCVYYSDKIIKTMPFPNRTEYR